MDHITGLSDALAAAVESAAMYTVQVNGRGYYGSTGIAWGPGVIVTADHTLDRDEDITVTLPDSSEVPGAIVGRDPGSDVAVLRVECDLSQTPRAVQVRVGSLVVAVGCGTDTGVSASLGIISAIGGRRAIGGRVFQGFIRPDLTMYPGFSGGPLVTVEGELIGMNTSRLGGGALTIPAVAMDGIVEQLLEHGRVRHAYLGLMSQPVRLASEQVVVAGQETALVITGVEPGSPASMADIIVGDALVELGGQGIHDTDDLRAALASVRPGQAVGARVIRGSESRTLSITVGER